MSFYQSVQNISNAMIHFKKDCRSLSTRSNTVQECLDALGDDQLIRDVSKNKGKEPITHVALAKYRAMASEANALVEAANAKMSEVHDGLTAEAIRVGLNDHVYKKNGGGDR